MIVAAVAVGGVLAGGGVGTLACFVAGGAVRRAVPS